MGRQSAVNLTLSVLCFSFVLALYEGSISLITLPGQPASSRFVKFAIAVGLFALLFQVAVWASSLMGRRWLSDESKLVGGWYQVFQIHNYTKSSVPSDAIRHGPVSIAFDGDYLEVAAENRRISSVGASSNWHSDKVRIQGRQVWLLYESTRAGRGSTRGDMLFQYQPNGRFGHKRDRLTGQFSDSSPATCFGSMELYRDEKAYQNRLAELSAVETARAAK